MHSVNCMCFTVYYLFLCMCGFFYFFFFLFFIFFFFFFFFQAEDGIRDYKVTGVQTCALPICSSSTGTSSGRSSRPRRARSLVCPCGSPVRWTHGCCQLPRCGSD